MKVKTKGKRGQKRPAHFGIGGRGAPTPEELAFVAAERARIDAENLARLQGSPWPGHGEPLARIYKHPRPG